VQRNQLQVAQQHLSVALQHDPNMQPARDLMDKLGGPQALQEGYNMYQSANQLYQGVRDLTSVAPAGSNAASSGQTLPAGYQPNAANTSTPAVSGTAPLTNLPPVPYVPSLEAGAGSTFR